MKKIMKLMSVIIISVILISSVAFAVTEVDNGIMKIYLTSGGLEHDELKGFDIKGYITTNEATNERELISSTYGDRGYHTFLNVNGENGVMSGEMPHDFSRYDFETEEEYEAAITEYEENIAQMQYTAYEEENEWQNINGIDLRVHTQFINDGEQLQIVYTLKNTTASTATISLATTSDVQIDGDDSATIERLEDGTGVRLWTKEGRTDLPVQFVFYGKNVPGTTAVDNLWIGNWGYEYLAQMFNDNADVLKVENQDSAFTYSWTNREIGAGETQTYSVLMEVGEVNVPNTGLVLDNGTKFYYTDVKINGKVVDKDLSDSITVHYVVDGTEYTLPPMSTTGGEHNFVLDLTSLNLSAGIDHTLKAWATDSIECDSNVEERTFTVTYLKNPELVVSEEEWTNEDVTFKIVDTVNVEQYVDKYQYRINEGEWTECEKDTDIPIEENGITKIEVRIVGTENNDYSDIITNYAKIDRVPPTDNIPTATSTTCSITVNSNQTDEHSGIDESKTMYAIKTGDTWGEWQTSNIFTGLTHNTEYVVKTKSTDMAGNTSESQELSVRTNELILGDLILKLNNSEGEDYVEDTWTNQDIYVAIRDRVEGATTTYYSKEGSAQSIAATSQETIVTLSGTTTILVSVTDGTNTITSDIEHILKVDKIAPVITELSLDTEEWTSTEKTLTGKANDALSGIVGYQFSTNENITINSEGWQETSATNEEIVANEQVGLNNTYYFYVKDAVGNIASVSIDPKIDNIGPIITFVRANGETAINVTDTGAGVESTQYLWTEENIEPTEGWKNYSEAVTYDGDSKGVIYLWAKATDGAGNITIESTVFTAIKVPTITSKDEFTNEPANFTVNSENEDEDISYQFKINDEAWQYIAENTTHTIANIEEGEVTISARVLDNAGRTSEPTTKVVKVLKVETPEEDDTTIDTEIPQTGESNMIAIIIAILIIGSVIIIKKVFRYKDI